MEGYNYLLTTGEGDPAELPLPIWLPVGTEFIYDDIPFIVSDYHNYFSEDGALHQFTCKQIKRDASFMEQADTVMRRSNIKPIALAPVEGIKVIRST